VPSFKMKFLGVTMLHGVEFSIFPTDFEWALQQCSATALPVILLRQLSTYLSTKNTVSPFFEGGNGNLQGVEAAETV